MPNVKRRVFFIVFFVVGVFVLSGFLTLRFLVPRVREKMYRTRGYPTSREGLMKNLNDDSSEIYYPNLDVTARISMSYHENSPTQDRDGESVFKDLVGSGDVGTEKEGVFSNIALADFYAFINSIQEKEGSVLKSWDAWDYKTYYALFDIAEVDTESSTITAVTLLPSDQEFLKEKHQVSFKCPFYSTAVVSSTNLQALKFDFYLGEELDPFRDRLYAYCLDESCTSIGNSCIVYRGANVLIYEPLLQDFEDIDEK